MTQEQLVEVEADAILEWEPEGAAMAATDATLVTWNPQLAIGDPVSADDSDDEAEELLFAPQVAFEAAPAENPSPDEQQAAGWRDTAVDVVIEGEPTDEPEIEEDADELVFLASNLVSVSEPVVTQAEALTVVEHSSEITAQIATLPATRNTRSHRPWIYVGAAALGGMLVASLLLLFGPALLGSAPTTAARVSPAAPSVANASVAPETSRPAQPAAVAPSANPLTPVAAPAAPVQVTSKDKAAGLRAKHSAKVARKSASHSTRQAKAARKTGHPYAAAGTSAKSPKSPKSRRGSKRGWIDPFSM